jgi:hypothetical protein
MAGVGVKGLPNVRSGGHDVGSRKYAEWSW